MSGCMLCGEMSDVLCVNSRTVALCHVGLASSVECQD